MIQAIKEDLPLADLCRGFPNAFENYLYHCRRLGYKERPDYAGLRQLFIDVRWQLSKSRGEPVTDSSFEWNDGKVCNDLETLQLGENLEQPDDNVKPDCFWSCFAFCHRSGKNRRMSG